MKPLALFTLAAVTAFGVWAAGAPDRHVAEVAVTLTPGQVLELTPPPAGGVADQVAQAGKRVGLDVADLHVTTTGAVTTVAVTFAGGGPDDLAAVLGELAASAPLTVVQVASTGPLAVTVALPVAYRGGSGTVNDMLSVGSPR